MWREKRSDLGYKEGFYLFGGMDERSVFHNDLWLIAPDYDYNRDMVAVVDCEFVGRSKLGITLQKIDEYSGRPPCPRSNF